MGLSQPKIMLDLYMLFLFSHKRFCQCLHPLGHVFSISVSVMFYKVTIIDIMIFFYLSDSGGMYEALWQKIPPGSWQV